MEQLFDFFSMINTNLLNKPEYILGLLAFIGTILLKKKFLDGIASFIKTVVGYWILTVGSNGLTNTFKPILAALNTKFNIDAAVLDVYFTNAAMYNTETGISTFKNALVYAMFAFIVAYFWNILLVYFNKWTKCRTVFVRSMHGLVVMEVWFIFILLPSARTLPVALLIGLLVGTRVSVFSNMTVEPTQKLTNNAGFAVGHNQMFGIWLADKLAGKIGDPDDGIEKAELPGWLSIMNDTTVSTAIMMTLFFGAIMLICGKDAIAAQDTSLKAANWFGVYIVSKCLYFSVYLNILIAGVRMFTGELIRSFKGISEKIIPGAIPAVDCAVTFGYAHPNVLMTGFVCGFIGQIVGILGLIFFKSPVLLTTGFIPVFFDNATIGIYANKAGGKKAAIILPFCCGLIQVLGGLGSILLFRSVGFNLTAWLGTFDAATYQPAILLLVKILGVAGIILAIVLMMIIPQLQYRKNKETYFNQLSEE